MSDVRFSGVLSAQMATIRMPPDRGVVTLLFDTFVFPNPRVPPDSIDAKQVGQALLIGVDAAAAPVVVTADVRGGWLAADNDGVEFFVDAHGLTVERTEERNDDSSFASHLVIHLDAGVEEFALDFGLRLLSGEAPRPDQNVVAIDGVEFAINVLGDGG